MEIYTRHLCSDREPDSELQYKPFDIIEDFFESFSINEIRQTLWQLVHVAVASENYFFQEFHQRDCLLLFYEKLGKLIDASFLITNQSANVSAQDS